MPSGDYTTSEVKAIWSEDRMKERWGELWGLHLEHVPKAGPLTDPIDIEAAKKLAGSKHEVVREIYKRILDGGDANAHLGLTSSDITDNARMMACIESTRLIGTEMFSLARAISWRNDWGSEHVLARTHLLPAKRVMSRLVWETWKTYLEDATLARMSFQLRGFRGSVGDYHPEVGSMSGRLGTATAALATNWQAEFETNVLQQNWSHMSACSVIEDIARKAISLNKVAQDCRCFVAFGSMRRRTKDATASSTLVHKNANPFKFERVIALMRLVIGDAGVMHNTLLTQMLQRTLDDSAVWRETLVRCYGYLHSSCLILKDELSSEGQWEFVDTEFENAELAIMRDVLDGKTTRAHADIAARYGRGNT